MPIMIMVDVPSFALAELLNLNACMSVLFRYLEMVDISLLKRGETPSDIVEVLVSVHS